MAEYIAQHHPEVEIYGTARWQNGGERRAIRNLENIREKVSIFNCDLNDEWTLYNLLEDIMPDAIFHLASDANVRESFDHPIETIKNNVVGSGVNFFETIRRLRDKTKGAREVFDPIIQHCSTSEVYGQVRPENVPIKETLPLRAMSPYGISKIAQDLLAESYFKNFGLKIIRTRMFSYFNPRRRNLFATNFAMQIAEIEAGKRTELLHGNLDSVRTLIDVRDAMASYWVAVQKCRFGEAYNIGGKKTISVGEFLELLRSNARCTINSCVDSALLRPTDVTLQIPDTSKFENATDWQSKYSFEESIEHLLEHCRKEVKGRQ